MNQHDRDNPSPASCGACSRCGPELGAPPEPLTGWHFALPAVAAFLIPLAGAVVGAVVAARRTTSGTSQLAGAAVGLAAGVTLGFVVNRALLRLFCRRQEDDQGAAASAGKEFS